MAAFVFNVEYPQTLKKKFCAIVERLLGGQVYQLDRSRKPFGKRNYYDSVLQAILLCLFHGLINVENELSCL